MPRLVPCWSLSTWWWRRRHHQVPPDYSRYLDIWDWTLLRYVFIPFQFAMLVIFAFADKGDAPWDQVIKGSPGLKWPERC